jgi:hypothetical protein
MIIFNFSNIPSDSEPVEKPSFKKSIEGQNTFPEIAYQNLASNPVPTNILSDLDIFILFHPLYANP